MATDAERIAAQAQRPAIVRLWEALVPLKSVISFMNSGAHPDDETSALLAALSRRDGIRIAYVCANRGEGGQNAIGTETAGDLGAIRTREMEEAARVLDMDLYWLSESPDDPIFDFGFSKSAEETFAAWGLERTLERFVRVIRTDRPDILCPTFLDVPGQHGHHRAMTRAAVKASELAADPSAFPEHIDAGLSPWQVSKFYLPAWSGAGDAYDDSEPPPNATVTVEAGDHDPVYGATYAQIAQWSRVMHRTQGMGHWVEPGPKPLPLHRLFARRGLSENESSILDGLPRTVGDLAALCPETPAADALDAAQLHIVNAISAFPETKSVLKETLAALQCIRLAAASLPGPEIAEAIAHRLTLKERQLARAAATAAGLEARLVCQPSVLTAGARADVTLSFRFDGPVPCETSDVDVKVPPGWTLEPWEQTRRAGSVLATFTVAVPDDTPLQASYRGRFSPIGPNATLFGAVTWKAMDTEVTTFVETNTDVAVLPPVSLRPIRPSVLYNLAARGAPIPLRIETERLAGKGRGTSVAVDVPDGWAVEPRSADIVLDSVGATSQVDFTVTPDKRSGTGRFSMPIRASGPLAGNECVTLLSHPHTGQTYAVGPATVTVQTAHVALPAATRIAYIDGGADQVPDRLRQVGLDVTCLNQNDVAYGDLSAFDTLVIGVFAYRIRPDLSAANARVKEFVQAGGNLVTLYHRPWDNWDPDTTPPRPLTIGSPSVRWRVTDQNASVRHLLPDHPLLNLPNRIGDDDWAGWQKERGLYFASDWDPAYEALLEMADPGEAPLNGALLSARIGAGRHTHTSLVLHHQLEQLVPGAYRLFANLVAPADRA